MKEVMEYKDFCEEKGLNCISKEAQAEYRLYTKEVNGSYLDEERRKASEILRKGSKKK